MNTVSNELKGHFAAAFTVLVWGSTFVSTKILLHQFGPVEILILRFLIGWSFLWLICPTKFTVVNRRHELLFALAGLTGVTMNYLLENIALMHTQASNLAVIVSTAPLFVGIFAFMIMGHRLKWNYFCGFLLSMIGIFQISFPDLGDVQLHLSGDLIGVGIAIVWGIYSILMEQIGKYGFDNILVTRKIFGYGILFMIPFIGFFGSFENVSLWMKPKNLALLLYLGIIACAVSYMTWNYAIRVIGSVKANLYIYASPVITILFSVWILHEKIDGKKVLGMMLTILGVILSSNICNKKDMKIRGENI